MLNLDARELDPYWQDPQQPLIVPVNPLHYEAHELQMLYKTMKVQAKKNPAQFNSKNAIDVLTRLGKLWTKINNGETDDTDDEGEVATDRKRSTAPAMGDGTAPGVDSGISADNPLTRERAGDAGALAVSASVPNVSRPLSGDQQA
jgi:hypothetical protein